MSRGNGHKSGLIKRVYFDFYILILLVLESSKKTVRTLWKHKKSNTQSKVQCSSQKPKIHILPTRLHKWQAKSCQAL